jgi:Xaa-Pro aminopeptidase
MAQPGIAAGDETEIGWQLERRRREVADRWGLRREVVVIGSGEPVPIPGRGDLTYPFRAHSEYFYLTDRERPGGVLAFDPETGWVDFVVPVSRAERLWEGAPADEQVGTPITEFVAWLSARRERPIAGLGAPVSAVAPAAELTAEVRSALNYVRRPKDAVELERMRTAERATSAGFAALGDLLSPGRTEREVQIELEAEFLRHGADRLAYETIVAGGPNSAALHNAPTARPLSDGELVLIDAGGEFRGYASDVTRTYPVSGRLTPEQAAIHELVRSALQAATSRCTAGTEWREVHRTAALVIAAGLAEFGLLRGGPETLVESGAVSLFFPHGIGHMVGLGVRDASEILPGRGPDSTVTPGLRTDLPLAPGHVVTVEPGIYFVPALLGESEARGRLRDEVDWDRADAMLGFGGIRIENNVLVTHDGYEVLTSDIPLL